MRRVLVSESQSPEIALKKYLLSGLTHVHCQQPNPLDVNVVLL